MTCVPGIPIKRYNPCISPTQEYIPHVVELYTAEDGEVSFHSYKVNMEYYSEYEYVIQIFIDNVMMKGTIS